MLEDYGLTKSLGTPFKIQSTQFHKQSSKFINRAWGEASDTGDELA